MAVSTLYATPRPRRRLLSVLALVGVLLGAVLVLLAGPRSAAADVCITCGGGGGTGTTTHTYSYTLTVNRPTVGTVTSTPAAISCPAGSGGTCSVTQSQTDVCDPTCSPDDLTWTTYTLGLAGGLGGYNPAWTNCPAVDATTHTCSVGMEGNSTITPGWADVQPPSLTGLSAPSKTGPTLNVTGSATDNSGTVAKITFSVQGTSITTDATPTYSGGAWSAGASLNLSSLSEGTYTIVEAATDSSLNVSTPLTHSVTVDKSVRISDVPLLTAYQKAIPMLTFTPDADVPSSNVGCRVYASGTSPSAAYGPCTSSTSFAPGTLADGSWTYDVRVTDDVGNTASVTRSFTLDTLAPVLSESAGPNEGQIIKTSAPGLTVGETELHPSTFTCTIDGATQACSSATPVALSNLSDGAHTFVVTATDAAGNSATFTRDFVVDTVAPALSESAGPTEGQTINTAGPDITFAESELHPGTTACTIDGAAGACSSATPVALSNLSDGAHTFAVTATDAAGNSAMLTRNFSVDTTPPVLGVDGPSEGGTVATSSIHVTPIETERHPQTLECRLDEAAFTPCTPGTQVALTGLSNGTHSFIVHAVDAAGNQATLTRTFWVQVPSDPGPSSAGSSPTSPGGSNGPGGGSPTTTTGSHATPQINASLTFTFKRAATWTVFRSIVLRQVPRGAAITVSCTGAGCPRPKHWTLHHAGTVAISAVMGHRLGAGARMTVTVTEAGMRARTFVLTVRRGKAPAKTTR